MKNRIYNLIACILLLPSLTYGWTVYNDVTVTNTLTSTSTVDALSAAQGKTLQDGKAPLASPTFTGNVTMPGTGIWNSSGNAGIGVVSPETKLHVQTNNNGLNIIGAYKNLNATESGGNAVGFGFLNESTESTGNWWKAGIVHERLSAWGRGTLHFLLDDAADNGAVNLTNSAMAIKSNGNVGIGNTTPTSKLTVGATNGLSNKLLTVSDRTTPATTASANGLLVDINAGGGIYMTGDNGAVQAKYEAFGGSLGIGTMTNHPVYLSSNSTNRMTILGSGNVGIGTPTPTSALQVVGLPTYADNTAALAGGLTAGAFYRTSTGVLMVTY